MSPAVVPRSLIARAAPPQQFGMTTFLLPRRQTVGPRSLDEYDSPTTSPARLIAYAREPTSSAINLPLRTTNACVRSLVKLPAQPATSPRSLMADALALGNPGIAPSTRMPDFLDQTTAFVPAFSSMTAPATSPASLIAA